MLDNKWVLYALHADGTTSALRKVTHKKSIKMHKLINNIIFNDKSFYCPLLRTRIWCLFDPWSGKGKNQDPDPGYNIPYFISESLETIYWVKNT